MYAVEFETVAKDGYIHIPDEYKDKIDNKQNIRLVVMYDDIQILEQLFLASNNTITVTKEKAIDTDGMIYDNE